MIFSMYNCRTEEESKKKTQEVSSLVDSTSGMSAREKNRLKRKAKQMAKDKEKTSLRSSSDAISQANNNNADEPANKRLR
jgi:hypothetical protein